MSVDIRFLLGGCFILRKDGRKGIEYTEAEVYVKKNVDPDLLSRMELVDFIKEGTGLDDVSELWFCSKKDLLSGLQEIKGDKDILMLCASGSNNNTLDVYCVQGTSESPNILVDFENGRCIRTSVCLGSPSTKNMTRSVGPTPTPCPHLPPKHTKTAKGKGVVKPTLIDNPLFENSPTSSVNLSTSKSKKNAPKSRFKPLKPSIPVVDANYSEVECSEDGELLGFESSDDDSYVADPEKVFDDDSDSDGNAGDDGLFDVHVDPSVKDDLINPEDVEEDCFDVRVESDDYRSYSGSDDEKRYRYPEFNPLVDFSKKIAFKAGMRFGSNIIFRKALRQYCLENGFDFYYLHNDGKRISAYCMNKCACPLKHGRKNCKCNQNLCSFKACARRMGPDGSFQLKTWEPEHACTWQDKNTKVSSVWLAEKYLEHYRDDPQWRIKGFIAAVKRDYLLDITYNQAWRARMKALIMTQGYAPEQYGKIWDYAATVLKWNPGTSVYVKPEEMVLGSPEMPLRFQRFYVCLQPCKEGFKRGCRPIIGLDGCHLKGLYTGQVLTAVGKDGNENIFPIAYAVVERETKETWCWFLEILIQDIGTQAVTFMSDRQKGLIEALTVVAPRADTRVCVRHMLNNFSKQWPGKNFKDCVWAAAKATTLPQFQTTMKVINDMDEKAYRYLMNQQPCTWSLHAFKFYTKSDMQLNNACESFNSCILEGREMPILSMCEWIRRKLMRMFISKRNKMRCEQGLLTPEAWKKIEKNKSESLFRCRCFGEGDRFEVDCCGSRYVVDLLERKCGCNLWEITGLPCSHAICCILKRRLRVEDFVHPYFHRDTYLKAYELNVNPMPGKDQWEKTNQPPLDPPKLIVQPGRPKKKRRKEAGEGESKKVSRVRHGKNKCSNCGQEGHTKKSCKNTYKPPEPKRTTNTGRPVSQSTQSFHPQKRHYSKRKPKTPQPEHGGISPSVEQVQIENDPDVQAMIEMAIVHEENSDVVNFTQQSQTSVNLERSSAHTTTPQTQQSQSERTSLPRMKSIGLKKSPIKRVTRSSSRMGTMGSRK